MIEAFAVMEAGGPVVPFQYTPLPLGSDQVEIAIDACGVCHSDLHQQCDDWGAAKYPIVLGHEIIGRITAMGNNVHERYVGQRVGVGPQTGSCETCTECTSGREQLCAQRVKSYNSPTGDSRQPYTYGGFSKRIRVQAKWAFPIPENLDTKTAAPILCAGETTWSPFVTHSIGKGSVVGVIGIGGLGHIAIQIAHARGCQTTAISTSPDKADEARRLGADHFLNAKDPTEMALGANTFDFLLSTISADGIDWTPYLNLLRPGGVLCLVGLPGKVSFRPGALVTKELSFTGSYLVPPSQIPVMLQFVADHGIQALIEDLPMTAENCNVALKRVADNAARYRMVLVNPERS
ncbi:Enoyl reductase (ER) domain-containing protein [Plasmodiophora brassicae]